MAIDQAAPDRLAADEDRRLAAWGGQEVLHLELLMDYSDPWSTNSSSSGVCSVRWSAQDHEYMDPRLKVFLSASLYARILTVGYADLIFNTVATAIRASLEDKDAYRLTFEPLYLTVPGSQNVIWPWKIAAWSEVETRRPLEAAPIGSLLRAHTATLFEGPVDIYAPGGFYLRYRPDLALNRVLMPAAALIVISAVWAEVQDDGRALLLWLLAYINQYFQAPNRVSPTPSDALAVRAATEVVTALFGRGEDITISDYEEANRQIADFRRRDDDAMQEFRKDSAMQQQYASPKAITAQAPADWLEDRLTHLFESGLSWFRRR
jgi:hypothetical protein